MISSKTRRCMMSFLAAVCVFSAAAPILAQGSSAMMPDSARVLEIAGMLPEKPVGLGVPITDRAAWDALGKIEPMASWAKSAEPLIDRAIPPLTEKFYLDNVASGSRANWSALDKERGGRLSQLVLAECVENQGRFLPKIEEVLDALFTDHTWIVPLRKEQSVNNWQGRGPRGIDLGTAMRAWEVALTDYLLGERLRPETRTRLRAKLHLLVFDPYLAMLKGSQKADFWLTTTNNWNAVCLSGVTGAALTILESRDERALFVAAAEKLSKNFLSGYPPDGYCTEGLSYYNFGFDHYLAMAETLLQATGGKLDPMDVPNMRNIAGYGARIEITGGVYPAIADCAPDTKPRPWMMWYTSRRLGLGLSEWDNVSLDRRTGGGLYASLINIFPSSASKAAPAATPSEGLGLRSWFGDAGILVCRPADGASTKMGACLKGGHNAEHHNHNDVGTFIVAVGGESPIMDAGAEVYTNRTFSPQRYESDILNSYGHAVPVIAGQLQKTGREAAAKVVESNFTDAADRFILDLSAAYDVKELTGLKRTFVYDRTGKGSLTVTDTVSFSTPQTFETALISLGNAKQLSPGAWLVYGDREALRVDIETDAGDVQTRTERLKGDLRVSQKALRLGVALSAPVAAATLTMRITPADHPDREPGKMVRNGGFEEDAAGWQIPAKSMGEIVDTQAASGKKSLRIVDPSKTAGSNILSARMPCKPEAAYELRGKVYPVSGDGLGVYVKFMDDRDQPTQTTREQRLQSIATVGGKSQKWEPFTKSFTTLPGTTYLRIWVHSGNASEVEAYLDDLEIVEK